MTNDCDMTGISGSPCGEGTTGTYVFQVTYTRVSAVGYLIRAILLSIPGSKGLPRSALAMRRAHTVVRVYTIPPIDLSTSCANFQKRIEKKSVFKARFKAH